MRTKIKSIIIFIVLFILAFIALAIISDDTRNYEKTAFSSYSVEDVGSKAFYLSVEKYGKKIKMYDTDIYSKYARFLPDNSLTIMIEPNFSLIDQFELNSLRNYIKEGNSCVIISSEEETLYSDNLLKDMSLTLENGNKVYRYGTDSGQISFFKNDVLNGQVKKDLNKAAELLVYIGDLCKEKGYDKVLINEYYHTGVSDNSGSDIYGMGLTLLMVQIIITLLIWSIYKGVRLGKPDTVTETIKRNETENIYALANLYKKTKSPRIAFDVHMEGLLADIAIYLGFNTIDDSNRDAIYSEIKSDKKLKELGAHKLLSLYESGEKISINNIKTVIDKIEMIRREL